MNRQFANVVFRFAQGQTFWKVKRLWNRIAFGFSRTVFYRREGLRTKWDESKVFVSILGSVTLHSSFLVLLLLLIEVSERFLVAQGWDFGILKPPSDPAKSYSSTDYVLQALTGIQGVFLAVYFTAVSVAASAIYADVPHEVRMLLARDRWGRFFLQFVAACTAVALLVLGYRGLGGSTGKGVLGLCVFLGCYSIFAMLVVLKNSITLFDPAKVGRVIFRDLLQAVRSASVQGYAWGNRSSQVGYSDRAASSLRTLGMVVDICTRKPGLGNRPLSDLMSETLRAWASYAHHRRQIPFESDWYRPAYRHKRWLLAQEHEVSLALNTQTTLYPEAQRDHNWLEAELLHVLERGLTSLLERRDIVAAHEGLMGISGLVRRLTRQLDTTNLSSFQAIAKGMVDTWTRVPTAEGAVDKARDEREEIGLADALGMIPIAAALGLRDWAEALDFDALSRKVKETEWSNRRSAYLCEIPYGALGDFEKLQERLAFEIAVEGKPISPTWYVEEIILLGLMRALKPCVDQTVAMADVLLKHSINLVDSSRYRSATALILRSLEFVDKLRMGLSHARKVVQEVDSRSKIKDLPWATFDFEVHARKTSESRRGLLKLLGKLVPIHGALTDDVSLPDFFGSSYIHVLDETFSALIEDDEDRFREFFPVALRGGFTAFDKLEEHVEGWLWQSAASVRADVLIDILEIGSYAKFMSVYREKPGFWDACAAEWDKFLSSRANPDRLIDFVVSMVDFRSRQFGLTPRDTYRHHWRQALSSLLKAEGSLIEAFYVPGRGGPARHPYPGRLVRKICTTFGMGINWPGADLFLIAYFENHLNKEAILKIEDRHGMRKALDESPPPAGEYEDDLED